MKMNRFNQQGLTLLELMMVIAIIGILMTIAIPSYQRYNQKAKFSEVIQAVAPYKMSVNLCAYQQGDLSLCGTPGQRGISEDFQAASPGKGYVKTINVGEQGEIIARSQRIKLGQLESFEYRLKPTLHDNGSLTWEVDSTTADSCTRHYLC